MPPSYRRQIVDHLGLVAGRCDALGMGAVLDQVTHPTPETRMVTAGHAVKAMVLHGWGVVNPPLYLVPLVVQHTPRHRLMVPGIEPPHLHDEVLGRAVETLYDGGVPALSRLMAVTAARRVGLTPRLAPLDRPSFHVEGRDHRAEAPDAQVMHSTRGDSRDPRPERHPVLLDLMVEQQAGIPLLMHPRSGHTRAASDVGPVVTAPVAPRQTTSGTTYLVAESALDREANLPKLAHPGRPWMPRVPATWTEAPTALHQATPATRVPLRDGSRDHGLTSP